MRVMPCWGIYPKMLDIRYHILGPGHCFFLILSLTQPATHMGRSSP